MPYLAFWELLLPLRTDPLDFISPASISCLAEVGNFLDFPFNTILNDFRERYVFRESG